LNKGGEALARLSNLLKREVCTQEAYSASPSNCPVRLDANESPYSLPKEIHEELLAALKAVEINRYPEPGARSLLERYATAFGVRSPMLMMGNGSDELIQILCLATAPTTVLVPSPTFVMYRLIAINCGHRVLEIPLKDDLDIDLDEMMEKQRQTCVGLTFLSYPNNPTGNCFTREKIEKLLQSREGFVVIDEAYGHFSNDTFLPLIENYHNLIILKSLSKIGLAALRLGFMIGNELIMRELNKVRLPYNVNAYSQVAASFYLSYEEVFQRQIEEIKRERERLYEALKEMRGIIPYPSQANFVFFRCDFSSDLLYEALKAQGILIRNFPYAGRFRNCLRVTVGKPEENELFIETLRRILKKLGV